MEDIVNNSTIYQMIIERGIERGIEQDKHLGAKAFAIDHILHVLNNRFNVDITSTLTPALKIVDDLDDFKKLLQEATEAEHLEDFIHVLETCGNGTQ